MGADQPEQSALRVQPQGDQGNVGEQVSGKTAVADNKAVQEQAKAGEGNTMPNYEGKGNAPVFFDSNKGDAAKLPNPGIGDTPASMGPAGKQADASDPSKGHETGGDGNLPPVHETIPQKIAELMHELNDAASAGAHSGEAILHKLAEMFKPHLPGIGDTPASMGPAVQEQLDPSKGHEPGGITGDTLPQIGGSPGSRGERQSVMDVAQKLFGDQGDPSDGHGVVGPGTVGDTLAPGQERQKPEPMTREVAAQQKKQNDVPPEGSLEDLNTLTSLNQKYLLAEMNKNPPSYVGEYMQHLSPAEREKFFSEMAETLYDNPPPGGIKNMSPAALKDLILTMAEANVPPRNEWPRK